tara:strand:+ start:82 stop:501 length:420 start_codon:yes stop_codon:yes gene_type:complete
MAHKSSFDQEARKKAIDKNMPEDKPNPIMKNIRKGMTKFHEATTPPEELDALKRVKAKKAKAKAEAKAKERTKGLDERIKKSSDKAEKTYRKRNAQLKPRTGSVDDEGLRNKRFDSEMAQGQRKKEGDARIAELKKKGK